MKNLLTLAILAASALNSVYAAPSFGLFSSQYELDTTGREDKQGGTIVDRLRGDKRFTKFIEVLERERGLRDDLENRDKQTTVFAPTNEAFKKLHDDLRRKFNRNDRALKEEMTAVLRYHIAPNSKIEGNALHAGALIPTDLRLKSLGDRQQRVRVFKFHDDVWLNMHSRIVEQDMEAENGRIHAIDRVMVPPQDVTEMMYTIPTEFSTFLAALERTNLAEKIDEERGVTVFAPSNRAWKNLGFENLKYLFSCVGQKEGEGERRSHRKHRDDRDRDDDDRRETCKGVQDLKKILKYHVARELAYSTDMMEKTEMRLETWEGQELNIEARERRTGGGGGNDDDYDRDHDKNKKNRKGGRKGGRDDEGDNRDVRRYNFLINKGEARVAFTDGLASNGAIQIIDNVLVPEDVKLPHDRLG